MDLHLGFIAVLALLCVALLLDLAVESKEYRFRKLDSGWFMFFFTTGLLALCGSVGTLIMISKNKNKIN